MVDTWWLPRGGMGGVAEGGAGAGTPMVTTLAGVTPGPPVTTGSNSEPMLRWRLPVDDTPLEDWTESVERHLDVLVFCWRSLPGIVPGCWFQLSRL